MTSRNNYIRLKNPSPFSDEYAFIDCREHVASRLFRDENIKVHYKTYMVSDQEPYNIVFCKVKKKDRDHFQSAMKKLSDQVYLLGYGDYEDFCTELMESLTL